MDLCSFHWQTILSVIINANDIFYIGHIQRSRSMLNWRRLDSLWTVDTLYYYLHCTIIIIVIMVILTLYGYELIIIVIIWL